MSLMNFFRRLRMTKRAQRTKTTKNLFTPRLSSLERRDVPNGYLAIGAGAGSLPWVAIRVDIKDAQGGNALNTLGQPAPARADGKTDFTSQLFLPFTSGFRGGVHTATGNFDGLAATPDSLVTAAGAGGGPHVIIWNTKELADGSIVTDGVRDQFFAFDARFRGGVNITTGDLDGDGKAELICAAGAGGGPHVKVFKDVNGKFQLVNEFFAFDPGFRGGVSVASGQGYATTLQMRLVLNSQLPSNFKVVPYTDAAGNLLTDTVPGAAYGIPLVGKDNQVSDGGTEFVGPNFGYTVPNGVTSHRDATNTPLPYITVASGPVQYLSANLLNSFGQAVYKPNNFTDPNATNPDGAGVGDIVFAQFQNNPFGPNFAAQFDPTAVYGPFIRLAPVVSGGTVVAQRITRLTAPANADPSEVSFRNQLVVGAGPGGGPHVKVFDFVGTAGGGIFNNGVGKEFFAFDPNFKGGVNVAVNDVIANNNQNGAVTPGHFDYSTATTTFDRDTDQNSGSQLFQNFPFDTALYDKLKPDIIVSMASGGSQVRYFGDSAPVVPDAVSPTSDPEPAPRNARNSSDQRFALEQINFVAYLIDTVLAYDPNATALTNFQSLQSTNSLLHAIDGAFAGGVNVTAAAFRFDGSMQTGFYGFSQAFGPTVGSSISTNPVLAQPVFGAGSSPAGTANRGSRVRSFNQLGIFGPTEPEYQAYDDFQAFNDSSARGAFVSYGFGALPDNSNSLDVIYANYQSGVTSATTAQANDLTPYAVDTPLQDPLIVVF